MKNEWNDLEATALGGETGELVYLERLLEKAEVIEAFEGSHVSAKLTARNWVGDIEERIWIDDTSLTAEPIDKPKFTLLHRKPLAKLVKLDALPMDVLGNEIACSRVLATSPIPPVNALLHAALPYPVIILTQPEAILAIANTVDGPQRLHQIYGEAVPVLKSVPAVLPLAKACQNIVDQEIPEKLEGIFICYQGLLTFGDSPRQAYERLVDQVTHAELYLEAQGISKIPTAPLQQASPEIEARKPVRTELAALRQAASKLAGYPLILATSSDSASLSFCQHPDVASLSQIGPAIADHVSLTKRLPLLGRDVTTYQVEEHPTRQDGEQLAIGDDHAPRIILDPELGLCALGNTARHARMAIRIYHRTIRIILQATALGGYTALPSDAFVPGEVPARRPTMEFPSSAEATFRGEVALVTGGASGIGKACVESLLARGAAVVTMDINPAVATQYDRPDYLGLECDLTDEAAVLAAFETFIQVFGGLDMLVLNAGIFPAGCRIESLTLAEWQRVMRINLDSNLVLLREAYPLLKLSPRGGRVLVNASKNVLAPGAGAAAYSASKAAVTQMARVAALEWGKDHIRVNQIHPDAIFDTGIWTEEVLKARAAHYGMTVQQYKTRNVLGVELNSHYVGELVAEMLGPRFEKITGAQIPVDGGSDRVI